MSSTLENTSYKYRPLIEPDSFRLILLKPTLSPAAQVECSLLHSTLSICDREIIDHYTALSYVWGDPQQTRQISVDGYQMTITATLEAALRDLRDGSRVLRVWADALCIDQSNIEERNQQVRQMGRIYSTAHHTVIYLGPLTPQGDMVLQDVLYRSSDISEIIQAAEYDLLSRPWFSRVWVFQELVLSRDLWVQCGGVRVRWTDLCDLLIPNNSKPAGLELLSKMHFARERRIQTNLYNLLLSRRGLGATDARDMIFAHMGVASDRAALAGKVIIDYQQGVEHLYEDVAQHLIDTIGPKTMFFHLDDINHSARRQHLASWAPDWSLLPSSAESMYQDNRMNVVSLKPKLHYTFIQEPRVLAYIGYEVDIISNASLGIHPNSQQDSAKRTSYQQTVEDLKALYARVGGAYASGDVNGQYTQIALRGKEKEHEGLCLKIRDEWLRLIGSELPLFSSSATAEDLESHRRFRVTFSNWLTERAKQGIIFVGGDSEGMESILYTHLHPNTPPSVLNERKLAGMRSGRVGVVPLQARDGDVVVYVAGISVSVVLRPTPFADSEDLDRKIYAEFREKLQEITDSGSTYSQAFVQLIRMEKGDIAHATVIGECYVEGVIGWSFKDRYNDQDFSIFALH
jgi:hypothetical protein